MAPGKFFRNLKKSVQAEDLNRRVYNIFLLIGILFFPLSATGNYFQGLHIIAVINPLITALIMGILFYLSVKKNLKYPFFFCLAILAFNSVQWMFNGGGSSGGMQYFVLWTFIMATVMLRKRKLVVFVALNCLILLGLLIYEHLDGSLIVQYADKTARLTDIIVSASLTFVLASYTIHIIYSEINRERAKSEKLLLNILPPKIIRELKEKGVTGPEKFQDVTVLFSDFVGFTDLPAKIPVDQLIAVLQHSDGTMLVKKLISN